MNTRTRAPKVLLITLYLLIQSTLVLAQVPNYLPSNGLVGWWPFNGNANDESGNGNISVVNSAALGTDRFNNLNSSYDFDGSSSTISLGIGLTSQFSISLWVRPQHYITYPSNIGQHIIGTFHNNYPNTGFSLNINPSGYAHSQFWGPGGTSGVLSSNPLQLNAWNHLIVTYNGTKLKYYENGVFVDSTTVNSTLNGQMLVAGARQFIAGAPSFHFLGSIDDIGLWNRELTSSEIFQLSNLTTCITKVQKTNNLTICKGQSIVLNSINYSLNFDSTNYTFIGSYNGSKYYVDNVSNSWSSSNLLAKANGADLIHINDLAEQVYINSILNNLNINVYAFFIGLSQDKSSINYSEPNGGWSWSDNDNSTYYNWHPTEPNNAINSSCPNGEEFAEIYSKYSGKILGKWNDCCDFPQNAAPRKGLIELKDCQQEVYWSTGDTTKSVVVSPTRTTQYKLFKVGFPGTPIDSVSVIVSRLDSTYSAFAKDTSYLCNSTLTLDAGAGYSSYMWSNGENTRVASITQPGWHSITVTDSIGCSGTDSVFIEISTLNIALSTIQNILCHGDSSASIALSITGGAQPYSITWSTGSTQSHTLASLQAGTYWVEVTDGNGCIRRDTVVLTQPSAPLSGSASATNVLCHGGSSGSITLNIQGGTPPYQFLWSNGAQTPNLINVGAGIYSVVVTDANGCQKQLAAQISEPAAPVSILMSVDSVRCHGAADGSVKATASGGVAPYTFVWSTGFVSDSIYGLPAGVYSVTVTDVNGCMQTATDTVFESASPIIVQDSINHVACHGDSTGYIALNVNGGTSPYQVFWSDGVTGSNRSQIPVGWYHYTVTDALGCVQSDSIQVTQPLAPLSATLTAVNASCFGLSNGTVAVVATGGTAPYSYTWLTNPTKPGNALINVPAGNYPVMIQDANGCQLYVTAVVTEPTPLASTISVQNVACFGQQTGSATVTVNGGTPGYMYSWDGAALTSSNFTSGLDTGAHYVMIFDVNGCSDSISFIVNGPLTAITTIPVIANALCFGGTGSISLNATGGSGTLQVTWNTNPLTVGQNLVNQPAGTYSYTILDLNSGCMQNGSLTISEPAVLTATAAATSVLCHGDSSGQIQLTISGGTGPYAVAWNNPLVLGINPTSLPAGWYVYTVTDSNMCSLSDSIQITQPQQPLSLTTGQTSIGCFGDSTGTAWVVPNGGISPYTYAWIGSNVTNDTLNGVPAGAYTVVVTDSNGCTEQVTINVAQPLAPLNSLTSAQPVTCFGDSSGTASVLVIGGTSPYTYLWSDSASSTTSSINQLASGWYFVTITDNAGCSLVDSVFVSQPTSSLTIQGGTNSANCFNTSTGSAWVNASGGTAPYSYLWSTGSMNDSISMVLAGNYVVQVVDANGCSQSTVLTVSQPTALSSITSKQDILCHGDTSGSITVSPIGGQAPYSILWSTGDTLFALNNLAAGSYSAVITDSLGCSYPVSINLTEPNAPLALIGFSIDATCHGAQDGSIQVLASGGVGGYSFTLNGGTSSSSGIFTGLNSGSYSVVVTDANGCIASQVFVIDEPDSLIYTSIVNDVSCFGSSDGQVKLNITGGTNTYSILWNTGSQGTEVSGLNGGWYVFTVTDGNGCGFVDSVFVNEPSGIQLSITATNPECVNSFDGTLLISSSGGTGNYIYSVNGSNSTGSEEDLGPGEFIVTVTDDNGCTASQTVVLTESRNPCVEIPNWFSPDGNGQNETWVIPGFEFGSYQLFVVNVWGQKVYETRSENYIPWDGTFKGEPLPNGDYYYVVSSSDSSEPTFTGYVTILR